ncbi:unnamed protein product [Calicophoron daubneyi]|uniref:Uncharacterized protein n=1 Tax=Calicophoron daubneyi TaxID=300641 RepID=A0AAV2U0J6_CALDB
MAQRQYFSVVILLVSFKIMQTECSPPDHDFEILACDEVVGHRVGNGKVAGAYYAYSPLHLQRDLPTNVRSLTFASKYKTLVKQRVVSDSLESYVAKGDVLSVNLIAPNVKSFSILDTEIPNWSEDPWYFPNLRSLNYINDVVDSLRITTYGSDSLEILRIRQVSGSIIQFGYAPKLSKLRRFEISTDGKTAVTGLCEFISQLTMLEYILVVNVNNACLLNSIRNLKSYRKLRFVEIWMESEDIYQTIQVNDSTICSLFPKSIERGHRVLKTSPEHMRRWRTNQQSGQLFVQNKQSLPVVCFYAHGHGR